MLKHNETSLLSRYNFTLQVQLGDKNDYASCIYEIQRGEMPTLLVATRATEAVDPDELFVASVLVNGPPHTEVQWINDDEPGVYEELDISRYYRPFFAKNAVKNKRVDLIVSKMEAGKTYRFTAIASSPGSEEARASLIVETKSVPLGGSVTVRTSVASYLFSFLIEDSFPRSRHQRVLRWRQNSK